MPKTVLSLGQLINFLTLCSGHGSFGSTDTTLESEPQSLPYLCLFSTHPSVLQPPLPSQLFQIPPSCLFFVSALALTIGSPCQSPKAQGRQTPCFCLRCPISNFSWSVPGQPCNDRNNSCLCWSLPGESRVTGESGFGNLHL